jgi:peptide/nickel transport system permease protein
VNGLRAYLAYIGRSPMALIGTLIVVVYLLMAVFAPFIAPYDPLTPTPEYRTPPSIEHLFGTDPTGLDIFSRVVHASRVDLTVGIVGTAFSFAIGVPLGLFVGYYRSWTAGLVMRIADLVQAFPVFVLAMAFVAVAGASIVNVIAVIGILNVPVYVRLVRSKILTFRELPVIEAARLSGNTDRRILLRYVLPNTIEPAIIQASVNVGWAILVTSSLSFIGAGIPVPTAEWGAMVSVGAPMILIGQPWAAFFPGLAIGICVFGFAAVGDAIRVLLNPERRY